MGVRQFCDRCDVVIPNDEVFYSVLISEVNTTVYSHANNVKLPDGSYGKISVSRSMICKKCAIIITSLIQINPDMPRPGA